MEPEAARLARALQHLLHVLVGLVRSLGTCCMTAEQYRDATEAVGQAREVLASVREAPPADGETIEQLQARVRREAAEAKG